MHMILERPQSGHTVWLVTGLLCASTMVTTAGAREPLTWQHVYGRERIAIRDPAPRNFVWLDDRTLLRQESSWQRIDAVTGRTSPFYDAGRLRQQLVAAGISDQDSRAIADGHWTLHDTTQRLCILQTGRQLIRAGLDGDRIRVVNGLPEQVELLTLSPTGSACAFVSNNNLWSADFETGSVIRLTQDTEPHLRNGKADWIYFEEILHRKWKAFYFSPDGRFLVFQQFDDTNVPTFTVVDHTSPEQTLAAEHFPKAGDRNPLVRLGIVAVEGGPITWLKSSHHDHTTLITHFGWYPDSNHIYWYVQNRSQTWLDVVRSSAGAGTSEVLLRETTAGWVDQPGDLQFLHDGSFLLLSERSGWRHVERISADGQSRRPVTSGVWDVNRIHVVNEQAGWIIVTGTRDSPIADNIYRISLENGSVTRLSQESGHHVASVSRSGSFLVDTWSSHSTRTSVVIRDTHGQISRQVHRATPPDEWDQFEFGDVRFGNVPLADGQTGRALFIFPPGFDDSQPHPVWLRVYGGPRYPKVKDAWNARLDDHLLASQGIVVLRFDPQIAGGHGAAGAWKAHRQLGVEETRDIESVCAWLNTQTWANAARIGMSGHSYGGFLTSYLMTHSDCLAAGIAGSPVTDWANYDSIYTERYMGTPQENPNGYRNSSVVAAASHLHGRLLLVHGLRDDNVHPANTFQLVRALQEANKQFDLMIYPRARHGIHDQHYRRLQYDFILQSLGIVSPQP
jgi:dipeptidyl-peptidase-4